MPSCHVGSLAPSDEDENGHQFHAFLREHGLAALNTFDGIHSGQKGTRLGNRQHPSRIDYIAVPIEWLAFAPTAVVDTQLDVMLEDRRDHFPVTASITVKQTPCELLCTRRKAIASRTLMKSPDHIRHFRALISQCPADPWQSHNNDHHNVVFHYIQQCAMIAFPLQEAGPKKEWISESS